MRDYHLFAGCGGGILGSLLNGHTIVGACENYPHAQKILSQRQSEGILPQFPIWDDICTLPPEDLPHFDILSAGFPCQAFSTAARGRNLVEKNLWGETLRLIKTSSAPIVFLENVSEKAIHEAKQNLETIGYRTTACSLSASDFGAIHERRRYWLCAYANNQSQLLRKINAEMEMLPKLCIGIWKTNPHKCGVVDEFSNRMDRFRSSGNGQIPLVAAVAQRVLVHRLSVESEK